MSKKCKIKDTFFNFLIPDVLNEMNLVLGKQCFRRFRKKCNLHSNPFPSDDIKRILIFVFIYLIEICNFISKR